MRRAITGRRKETRPGAVLLRGARRVLWPVSRAGGLGPYCRVKEPPHVGTAPEGLLVVSMPCRVAAPALAGDCWSSGCPVRQGTRVSLVRPLWPWAGITQAAGEMWGPHPGVFGQEASLEAKEWARGGTLCFLRASGRELRGCIRAEAAGRRLPGGGPVPDLRAE